MGIPVRGPGLGSTVLDSCPLTLTFSSQTDFPPVSYVQVRDRSLIKGRGGGLQNWKIVCLKLTPTRKGKNISHPSFKGVETVWCPPFRMAISEVSHVKTNSKLFVLPPLSAWLQLVLHPPPSYFCSPPPLFAGIKLDLSLYHFVPPPLLVINDQSLKKDEWWGEGKLVDSIQCCLTPTPTSNQRA